MSKEIELKYYLRGNLEQGQLTIVKKYPTNNSLPEYRKFLFDEEEKLQKNFENQKGPKSLEIKLDIIAKD